MTTRLRSFVRVLARRRVFDAGLDEEMRLHLELYTEDLVRSGVPRPEAERRARVEFGNLQNVRLDCRAARGVAMLDSLGSNLRVAIRRLRRTPAFTAGVTITLALALGSTLTVAAVVDAVLLRPLPFPHPGDLVTVYNTYPAAGVPNDGCSLTNYYERRGRLAAFAGFAAYREQTANVGPPGAIEREFVTRVTPDFFATLGAGPVLGRPFAEDETAYAASRVAILTDAYWADRLNRAPDVIGRTLRVDGTDRIVIGVLPAGFRFLSSRARIYLPLASDVEERGPSARHSGNSRMVARLRPDVSIEEGQAQIDAHNAALESTNPDGPKMAAAGFRSIVVPLRGDHVRAVRPILLLLQAAVLLLLVLAAVNVTNLFLIRASSRAREFAVRQAIGAGRWHVVLEVTIETLVVALAGGIVGVPVGAWGVAILRSLGAEHLPMGANVGLDARLALAAVGGAAVLGVLIALPVAWYQLRGHAGRLLPEARGATASRGVQRVRNGFVVAQIALAFVLLAGAGLLALSLKQVMTVSPGFRPDHVLTAQMTLPGRTYPDRAALLGFADRLMTALAAQPGTMAAGFTTNIPLSGIDNKSAATVKGYVPRPGESLRGHYSYSVGGDYFAALGYSLAEGRFLTADDSRSPRACVVDEVFARRYWPGGDAIGQIVFQGPAVGADDEGFRVVGVVGAVRQAALAEDDAIGAVYYPFGHRADRSIFVVARTTASPDEQAGALRQIVRRLDAELPVTDLRSMQGRIDDSLVSRRSPAFLAAAFSLMAVLLAAIGTYGVLACAVEERRREIALRMALGARPAQVCGQFVALTLRLVTLAGLFGGAGAWFAGRAMRTLLFQVPPLHAPTLAASAAVVVIVSAVACLLPAQRAARIPPIEALSE